MWFLLSSAEVKHVLIFILIDNVNASLLSHSSHTHTRPLLISSQYGPCITRRPLHRHTPLNLCALTHTRAHGNSWGARWRVTWNAHNGSRGINFSHFICLLLHGEQLGWRRHNKQDIVVSGFLLRLLMLHADPYIKMTESAVCITLFSSNIQYSEGTSLHAIDRLDFPFIKTVIIVVYVSIK